jgi:predicted RNA-binding protein with PUA-like domain
MPAWLVKSEPGEYGYADLEADGMAEWDGVKNALAQRHLGSMREGDTVVIYHSGGERAAVGLARVVKGPYPDPSDQAGKRVLVDLKAERKLARPVTLAELKVDPTFAQSPLVRMSRLSVMPLEADQLALIERLGGSE